MQISLWSRLSLCFVPMFLSRLELMKLANNDERVAPHPRLVLLVHSWHNTTSRFFTSSPKRGSSYSKELSTDATGYGSTYFFFQYKPHFFSKKQLVDVALASFRQNSSSSSPRDWWFHYERRPATAPRFPFSVTFQWSNGLQSLSR